MTKDVHRGHLFITQKNELEFTFWSFYFSETQDNALFLNKQPPIKEETKLFSIENNLVHIYFEYKIFVIIMTNMTGKSNLLNILMI